MSEMKNIKLKVNESNLIQNLKHAFTQQDTFVAELMQNARRAKSKKIKFNYDDENCTLTIIDDGQGLKDPQDILTIAESGWDKKVVEIESPYGLGFLSAIYQAHKVEIESNGYKIGFNTDEVLGFTPIPVHKVKNTGVTRITLHGVPDINYESVIKKYSRGFPVRVIYGNKIIPRSEAVNNPEISFMKTDIGEIYVHGLPDDPFFVKESGRYNLSVYLQGINVYSDKHEWMFGDLSTNVIHIDPEKYKGRMPDRSSLVDESKAIQEIQKTIKDIWQKRLVDLCRKSTPEHIAEHWFIPLKQWDLIQQFDDIPFIPSNVLELYSEYPMCNTDWESTKSGTRNYIKKEDVENGKYSICLELETADDETGWQTAMYLYEKEAFLYDYTLSKQHWINKHVKEISQDDVTVNLLGDTHDAIYYGNYIYGVKVIFAETVELDGPLGKVTSDKAFAVKDCKLCIGEDTKLIDETIIVVPSAEDYGDVVRQLSYFMNNETFDENDMEEECHLFENFLLSERPGNEEELVKTLLNKLALQQYTGLHGKSFRLEVDVNGYRFAMTDESVMLPETCDSKIYWLKKNGVCVLTKDADGVYYPLTEVVDEDPQKLFLLLLSDKMFHGDMGVLEKTFHKEVLQDGAVWSSMELLNWVQRTSKGSRTYKGLDPACPVMEKHFVGGVFQGDIRPITKDNRSYWEIYATDTEGQEQQLLKVELFDLAKILLKKIANGDFLPKK